MTELADKRDQLLYICCQVNTCIKLNDNFFLFCYKCLNFRLLPEKCLRGLTRACPHLSHDFSLKKRMAKKEHNCAQITKYKSKAFKDEKVKNIS